MADNVALAERQLVVFSLGGEVFGVDISTVNEIIQMQAITAVPGTARFVEGLINLRGTVIPVVDLRKRFGLEGTERGKETRIMVLNSEGQAIGIIVDSVAEVLSISPDAIEPPSSMITTADSEYLLGIVKLPDQLVILLDTDRVLSREDHSKLATTVSREETKGEAKKQERRIGKTAAVASPEETEATSGEKVLAKNEADATSEEKVPIKDETKDSTAPTQGKEALAKA